MMQKWVFIRRFWRSLLELYHQPETAMDFVTRDADGRGGHGLTSQENTMRTRDVLVFSWGEVKCPPDKRPPHPRKDGQPDRRYKVGREWWDWFWSVERAGAL